MSAIQLSIDELLLDSENPRIGTTKSQRESLQKIIEDQGAKLAVLADDIASNGLSPLERILVIPEGGKSSRYVVVEGNRRLAALKILSNPNILSSLTIESAVQKKLERLAKEFNQKNIEPIDCFDIGNREEANKWIYLRHTGANEGRGVVNWSGLATARFRGSDPGLQALEFVKRYGNLTQEQIELIEGAFPITTLERLLSSREVRSRIGIDISKKKINSELPGKEIIKPLRRMVIDLAEKKVNVSNLKNQAQQKTYIDSFSKADFPNLSKKGTSRDLEQISGEEFSGKPAPGPKKGKKRKTYDPSTRSQLVPKISNLNVSVSKVAAIYGELKDLHMDRNPHSCAVLLRVFLELSVDYYMRNNSISDTERQASGKVTNKNLTKKMQEVITDLVSKGCRQKDFSGVSRALSDKKSPLSVDLLHAYVHNLFHEPKVRELRSAWDEAEPLFEQIWK